MIFSKIINAIFISISNNTESKLRLGSQMGFYYELIFLYLLPLYVHVLTFDDVALVHLLVLASSQLLVLD